MHIQTEKTTDLAPLVDDIIELGVASVETQGPLGSNEPVRGNPIEGISQD